MMIRMSKLEVDLEFGAQTQTALERDLRRCLEGHGRAVPRRGSPLGFNITPIPGRCARRQLECPIPERRSLEPVRRVDSIESGLRPSYVLERRNSSPAPFKRPLSGPEGTESPHLDVAARNADIGGPENEAQIACAQPHALGDAPSALPSPHETPRRRFQSRLALPVLSFRSVGNQQLLNHLHQDFRRILLCEVAHIGELDEFRVGPDLTKETPRRSSPRDLT